MSQQESQSTPTFSPNPLQRRAGFASIAVGLLMSLGLVANAILGTLGLGSQSFGVLDTTYNNYTDAYLYWVRGEDGYADSGLFTQGAYGELVLLKEASNCPSGPVGIRNGGVPCDVLVLVRKNPIDFGNIAAIEDYGLFNLEMGGSDRYTFVTMPDTADLKDILGDTREAARIGFAGADQERLAELDRLEAAGENPLNIPPLRVVEDGAGELTRMRLAIFTDNLQKGITAANAYQTGGVLGGILSNLILPLVLGPLLLFISMLRWGRHLLRGQREMAYLPGKRMRLGRYGTVIGIGTGLVALPFVLVALVWGGDLPLLWLVLGLSVGNALLMIQVSQGLDRAKEAA